jgi:tetratricopeptide (TPR) repeat protein
MKKFFFFSLFGFLFLFFAMASEAIVSVKLQELRFGILRDQLMNYELSSQTLRERLKQMFLSKDDYMTEVKVNILESGIMNSETEGLDLKMSWKDRFGLYVINSVRFLNLKSPLELEEQQNTIIRLQFAFYMERTRKYPIASKKYQELEESITSTLSDEMAFTLLHHGYCLVMMGEREKAFVKLNKAIDLFPGSHYAENASLLISFLEDGQKKKEELKSKKKSPEELAYSLFQSGDYEETLKTLESLPVLTNDQSYIKARSMEELGKTSNAVKEYIQLVKQKENKEVAIRANRRLLLIGNFYQENKSLVAFSKEEANKLGDTKAADNIEEGKSLVLKPVIIEKILKKQHNSIKSNKKLKSH